jgi:hypothetical protein
MKKITLAGLLAAMTAFAKQPKFADGAAGQSPQVSSYIRAFMQVRIRSARRLPGYSWRTDVKHYQIRDCAAREAY